jgi:hypothetical protein
MCILSKSVQGFLNQLFDRPIMLNWSMCCDNTRRIFKQDLITCLINTKCVSYFQKMTVCSIFGPATGIVPGQLIDQDNRVDGAEDTGRIHLHHPPQQREPVLEQLREHRPDRLAHHEDRSPHHLRELMTTVMMTMSKYWCLIQSDLTHLVQPHSLPRINQDPAVAMVLAPSIEMPPKFEGWPEQKRCKSLINNSTG